MCHRHRWGILWRALRWRHNGHDGISNHQPHHCLLNSLFVCRSKKTSKLRVSGLCVGNSPGTGGIPAQMASNVENVSIWWRHHEAADNLRYNVLLALVLNLFCSMLETFISCPQLMYDNCKMSQMLQEMWPLFPTTCGGIPLLPEITDVYICQIYGWNLILILSYSSFCQTHCWNLMLTLSCLFFHQTHGIFCMDTSMFPRCFWYNMNDPQGLTAMCKQKLKSMNECIMLNDNLSFTFFLTR